jgi:hypothetical protein
MYGRNAPTRIIPTPAYIFDIFGLVDIVPMSLSVKLFHLVLLV